MRVTVHAAKTRLSKLMEAALSGEDVVIARGSKPVVERVPARAGTFRFGLLKDRLTDDGPDFFESLDEEDLALWQGE